MTTIVYDGKDLYADKLVLRRTNPVCREVGTKLFMSQCGEFAYAIGGDLVGLESRILFEKEMRVILSDYFSKPQRSRTEIVKYEDELAIKVGTDINLFVLTSTVFFASALTIRAFMDTTGVIIGFGTGGNYAVGMFELGIDPKEIFETVNELDDCSSKEFDCIKRSSIKPFVIKEL